MNDSHTDAPSGAVSANSDYLWVRRHQALHLSQVSYRYHRKRQRFFDLLAKGTQALTVLLGASLLGESVKAHLPLVASAISGLGLLALVFGYSDRKQDHKEFAKAFATVQASIEGAGERDFTEAMIDAWDAELSMLNSREPPTLYALTTLCEYELCLATGNPDHIKRPPWHRRVLADWISFGPVPDKP